MSAMSDRERKAGAKRSVTIAAGAHDRFGRNDRDRRPGLAEQGRNAGRRPGGILEVLGLQDDQGIDARLRHQHRGAPPIDVTARACSSYLMYVGSHVAMDGKTVRIAMPTSIMIQNGVDARAASAR